MFSIFVTIISFFSWGIAICLYFQKRRLLKNMNYEKEIEKSKESFVATLVHDLKTPTNAQINVLRQLKNGTFGKLTSQQNEMITLTQNSCKYMSDLIGTIIDTYNYDAGEIHLNKTNFDIITLIDELCYEMQGLAKDNNQKLNFISRNQDLIINADRLQLKRVILNLISNAITYGFPNTQIDINICYHKNNIELAVKNISKPIPENELKTIFDKFKKTTFSHFNKTGTGLGLYLSKHVVELHNGEIFAQSFENGTCIFGFILPVKAAQIKDTTDFFHSNNKFSENIYP